MTGFEPQTSGLEATTLPTEPQPLPQKLIFTFQHLFPKQCDVVVMELFMNNWIGPTVKHAWNHPMRVMHNLS